MHTFSLRSRLVAKVSVAVGLGVASVTAQPAKAQGCQYYECHDDGMFGTHCLPGGNQFADEQ